MENSGYVVCHIFVDNMEKPLLGQSKYQKSEF